MQTHLLVPKMITSFNLARAAKKKGEGSGAKIELLPFSCAPAAKINIIYNIISNALIATS